MRFCYASITSAQSRSQRHRRVWADVILADFQRVISPYLQDISTYLSCAAQRVLWTVFMQKSKPKYVCLPSKIDRFCVRYDWWRRLQPTSSVSPVWIYWSVWLFNLLFKWNWITQSTQKLRYKQSNIPNAKPEKRKRMISTIFFIE